MAARKADDPLVSFQMRIPQSVFNQVLKIADVEGCTKSDAFRKLMRDPQMPELKTRKSRKAPDVYRRPVSKFETALLQELAVISNCLNQIACLQAKRNDRSSAFTTLELLLLLRAMERRITDFATKNGGSNAH